jgi:DNA-binding PadR family transcriptional regulator
MLLCKAMTVYEIRNYIIKNLTTVCSNSLGSIQTAIKKMLSKGYIEVREYVENGLNKKKYSITDKGLSEYKNWVGTPINLSKMTNMEESKLFFLGIAPKEKRISFLTAMNKDLEGQLKALTAIKESTLNAKEAIIDDNVRNISKETKCVDNLLSVSNEKDLKAVLLNTYDYQMELLEYSIERTKFDLSFYKNLLKKERAR